MVVKDAELPYLRRCVELATEALEAGDEPFGSVLVGADGAVLAEDRNRVSSGDRTRHPEVELARWSAAHLTPEERTAATVFTSGEHCPMCAAAHAWVGLGRIVFVASSQQLAADQVADDQRRVARRARAMQRQRDRGWPWGKILEREPVPGLLELLRRSGRRLTEATGRFAHALARGLTEGGESRRRVGRRLGVTHQRVSAMLKGEHQFKDGHDTPDP